MPKTTQGKRTQAERTATSKKKILEEATRLFGEKGFKSTKLSEVADAVDMTEPGVLHHFQSKENLLLSVLEERDRIDSENYFHAINHHGFDLFKALKSLIEHNSKVPNIVQLFTILVAESIPSDQPGHDFFINRYQNIRKICVDLLEKAKLQGEIRRDIPCEDLAIMMMALMDGLQIQWLLEPDQINMSRVFNLYLELLSAGVKTDTGQ